MQYFARSIRYLYPYWKLACISIVIMLLTILASLAAPWSLKIVIDNVLSAHPIGGPIGLLLGPIADNRQSLLLLAVVGGLAVALFSDVLNVLHNYVDTKLEAWMTLDFRSDMLRHAERLSLAYHDHRRSGSLIYAINYQANAAPGLILALEPLAQSILTLFGMFYIAFRIDPVLAGVSLIVLPFLYYSVGYYSSHIQPRIRAVKSLEGETLSVIHEAISMMRVIVAFGREDYEYDRFRNVGVRAVDARVKLTVRQTLFSLAVNGTTAVGTALVLGIGAEHVLQGRLTAGTLLVMLAYIAQVYKPLEAISNTVGSFQERFVSLQIAFRLLDTPIEIQDAPGALTIGRAQGRVTFEDVAFHYQGRVGTLKDVSFDAQAGQVVAIVGPTGAGKTTLISLIPRFYAPQSGHILLDGQDVRDITLRSLRDQVSIVMQEPLLFSGSIADNIRYGRLEASMEDIIAAAKAAGAHDFIIGLPRKYETQLGERGVQLSGGERQRISVARAFLKNAPVLILDEPTSSIDSKTEAVILDALDSLMVGRTTFIIAHRLSTIRRCDYILVMDKGRLVDSGTHEDLMRRGGLYKQLYDLQTTQGRRKPTAVLQPYNVGAADKGA